MTLLLIALWIAGHSFQWYWLVGSVLLDLLWMSIKLNFLAMLVRRAVEEALTPPPPPPPQV